MSVFTNIKLKEWFSSIIIASAVFLMLGTMTALWENPFFIRMTKISFWDYMLLGLESILIGLFMGTRASSCAIKKAGIGGVFGFLGFACPTCNKILMLVFGSSLLISYFEPVRYLVGIIGISLFSYALYQKMSLRLSTYSSTLINPRL